MEVSNEMKEDIRKSQSDLKNAIRVHQVWVARLQEDEHNIQLITKVKEAEKNIISISQSQKLVVERLRRELELYQHRLKARNKQIDIESDNRYVAQQLRDHQIQYNNRSRTHLKPSVLDVKSESNEHYKEYMSDSENELKSANDKENSNNSESDEKEKYSSYHQTLQNSRHKFASALNKFKEKFVEKALGENDWHQRSDSDSSQQLSPTPSPPPLPKPGEPVTQEVFMWLIGLITPSQKDILEKKRNDRRKLSNSSTNRNEFLYGNYDMLPKRKKYNQFPYLQTHNDPPETRSAKQRKQQNPDKSSREGSPSESSTENKCLSIEPVYSPTKKICHSCDRSDVPSLLVWCVGCAVWQHTGCGDGRCASCYEPLPDPPAAAPRNASPHRDDQLYRDKLVERKRLHDRNIELCMELRKLEARAATLKENLDEHSAEKRQLLADQIKTQRNLQKLLDFISQFKETSLNNLNIRSPCLSESSSDISKSIDE